jgi:hypothetical protein
VGAAVALVLGLVLSAFETYIYISYTRQTASYDAAPSCTTIRDTANCKYESSAVVSAKRLNNGDPEADMTFPQLGGKVYTAVFLTRDKPYWDTLQTGKIASAELWNGYVSKIGGVETRANPDRLPNAGVWPTLIFGFFTLVIVVVLVVLRQTDRRAALR